MTSPTVNPRFRDPLSEVARKERLYLLGTSMVGITINYTGLVPAEITTLGIKFGEANQNALFYIFAIIVAYFLAAFVIYAASDFVAWVASFREWSKDARRRFREDIKEQEANRTAQWDQIRDRIVANVEEQGVQKEISNRARTLRALIGWRVGVRPVEEVPDFPADPAEVPQTAQYAADYDAEYAKIAKSLHRELEPFHPDTRAHILQLQATEWAWKRWLESNDRTTEAYRLHVSGKRWLYGGWMRTTGSEHATKFTSYNGSIF